MSVLAVPPEDSDAAAAGHDTPRAALPMLPELSPLSSIHSPIATSPSMKEDNSSALLSPPSSSDALRIRPPSSAPLGLELSAMSSIVAMTALSDSPARRPSHAFLNGISKEKDGSASPMSSSSSAASFSGMPLSPMLSYQAGETLHVFASANTPRGSMPASPDVSGELAAGATVAAGEGEQIEETLLSTDWQEHGGTRMSFSSTFESGMGRRRSSGNASEHVLARNAKGELGWVERKLFRPAM